MNKPAQIFISYASQNQKEAIKLYDKLLASKFRPWMDVRDISAGTEWKLAIDRALRASKFVVVLLSSSSLPLRGFFKYEIDVVLDLRQRRPRRKKFIFPVRLDGCDVTSEVADFQWVDFHKRTGWSKLLQSLNHELCTVEFEDEDLPFPQSQIVSNLELLEPLTTTSFAYSRPDWLTRPRRDKFSELAKVAFVLLLFEQQPDTGCWGKSYLPKHLKGGSLPEALGAITGTPFALLVISSYAKRMESEGYAIGSLETLGHQSTQNTVFATLGRLLQPDGRYLRD